MQLDQMTDTGGAEVDAASSVSLTASRKAPCAICGEAPRLGTLSRCRGCIRKQAEADLKAQAEVRARAAARAEAEAERQGHVKRCRTCKETKSLPKFAKSARAKDGRRRDCRDCVASGSHKRAPRRTKSDTPESRAAMRAAVKSWKSRNPEAHQANQILNRAIKSGLVARPQRCQIKGCRYAGRTEGHHADYSQPLQAIFCCPSHHRRIHAGEIFEAADGLPPELVRVPQTDSLSK